MCSSDLEAEEDGGPDGGRQQAARPAGGAPAHQGRELEGEQEREGSEHLVHPDVEHVGEPRAAEAPERHPAGEGGTRKLSLLS